MKQQRLLYRENIFALLNNNVRTKPLVTVAGNKKFYFYSATISISSIILWKLSKGILRIEGITAEEVDKTEDSYG